MTKLTPSGRGAWLRKLDSPDCIGALVLLLFALVYLKLALDIPVYPSIWQEYATARTLPIALAWVCIGVCVLQLTLHLIAPTTSGRQEVLSERLRGLHWRPVLGLFATMLAYATLFELLGFVLASIGFLLAGFYLLGERRLGVAMLVATLLVFGLWLVLTQVFSLVLTSGMLYSWLVGFDV